jgi:hypothetical protein
MLIAATVSALKYELVIRYWITEILCAQQWAHVLIEVSLVRMVDKWTYLDK